METSGTETPKRAASAFQKAIAASFVLSPRRRQVLRKPQLKAFYRLLNWIEGDGDLRFMNYGYDPGAAEPLKLEPADERDRYGIQLYHRVASGADLSGREVLEVGCGRGGGSSFLMRYLQPRSVVGVDFVPGAVEYCRRQHAVPGLEFRVGDAEQLPFADASFDVVVNVESSHCYGSVPKFLGEVARVLRPGGMFLFADMRQRWCVELLGEQIRAAGLTIVEMEDLTPGTLRGLKLDAGHRLNIIRQKTPFLLRPVITAFSGLEGTPIRDRFTTGAWQYLRYTARK